MDVPISSRLRRLLSINKTTGWILLLAGILVLRMVIVKEDPVVPIQNDSVNYAHQANFYLASDPKATLPPQSPGLPIFTQSSTAIGIPYKLAIDIYLISIAAWAAFLVSQICRSRWFGVLTFTALSFSPWFFFSTKVYMSEPLASVLLLGVAVSAAPFLFLPPRRWLVVHFILAAYFSSALVVTRSELPVLAVFWGFVFLAQFIVRKRQKSLNWWGRARWLVVLIPLVLSVGSVQFFKAWHQRHYGVRALTVTEAPGFVSLLNALYCIDPDEKIRFAPVTVESLRVACDHSESMNQYREALLDPKAPAFGFAKSNLGLDGQVGTWLNWHLVRAFRGVNRKTDKEMAVAANEIRAALDDGRIKKRFGYFPISPLFNEWMPDLPAVFVERVRHSFLPSTADRSGSDFMKRLRLKDPVKIGYFDEGLLRRRAVGNQPRIRMHLRTNETGFARMRVFTASGKRLAEDRIERQSNGTFWIGFQFDLEADNTDPPAAIELLRHRNPGVKNFRIELKPGYRTYFEAPLTDGNEAWFVTRTDYRPNPLRNKIKETIRVRYNLALGIGAIVVVVLGFFSRLDGRRCCSLFVFGAVVIGFLLTRAAFYSLVEVWLDWGDYRYVEPSCLIGILGSYSCLFATGRWLRAWFPG